MEKKILEWAINNTTNDSVEGGQQQPVPEDKERGPKKIDPEIIDAILGQSDAVRMKEAINAIADPDETMENKTIAFDNLEMLVEHVDNANDIEKMNLWPKLISFVSLPDTSLRVQALWVCGTAVQNNLKAQKAFIDQGGLRVALDLLKNTNEDAEVKSKAVYAVSGAIKHYKPALVQFEKEGGYEALLALLQTSDNLPILRKTVFLFNTLVLQNPDVVAKNIGEKGLSRQMVKILEQYGEQDEDLTHKILTTFLTLLQNSPKSLSPIETSELKKFLPELKKKYGSDTMLSSEEWGKWKCDLYSLSVGKKFIGTYNKDSNRPHMLFPIFRELPTANLVSPIIPEQKWTPDSIRLGVLARKKGMTALWDEWGVRIPVTVFQLEHCQVIQVVSHGPKAQRENIIDIQIGCTDRRRPERYMTRALIGHFRKVGLAPKQYVELFHVTPDATLPVGTELKAAHFVPGQFVDVQGTTQSVNNFLYRINKGFQGVMKRWGFKGLPASHGTSLAHRSGGSTGQRTDPGKVFKGKKMAGRMGGKKHTSHNLQVIKIDNELNCLYIKGAVAGYAGEIVRIKDAIRKKGVLAFPKDALPPPFPTIQPKVLSSMPRELIAKTGGTDPFLIKES
ncbi:9900_t:CDS:10 [Ambispora gerdemannii]|uniref:Large ribosomal subunit protein uL3m n=1 Tax=Ambispora gerdemannii TaxID=144530 RepID=A0A9N9ADP9_9GLOM|nr:9900_t:CDS:10 [Ambispora gerdemannii]